MRSPIPGFRAHLATAVGGVALALAFLLTLLYLGHGLPSTHASYEVQSVLPTSGALAPGARVTMAGADVGTVRSVTRRGAGALVVLRITDDRVTPLAADSTMQLRSRTPVGENYVSITAGRAARRVPSGGALPMATSGQYVDVDQILTVMQGRGRARVRALLQGFGGGLRGHGGQLHAILGDTSSALTEGAQVVHLLARDREQVSALVDHLGTVAGAVGDRAAAIRMLTARGTRTFRAIAARDAALRTLLADLPATLDQVRSTSATVDHVTTQAAPVLADLAVALREVRPAVRNLSPAAAVGRRAVTQLGAAAPGLRGTLTRVRAAAGPASTAIPALRDALCQADPVIRYAKPYTDDVISALAGLGSAANAYDALGHTIRLTAILSDNSLVGLPAPVEAAAQTLLHSGLMSKTTGLSWDPYPKPGQIGRNSASGKSVLGPDAVPATGYTFPRVQPDC